MNFDELGQNGPKATILGRQFVLHEIGRHQFFGFLSEDGMNREFVIDWPESAPKAVKRLGMRGYDVRLKTSGRKSYLAISKGKMAQRDTAFRNVVDFLMRELEQSSIGDPSWQVAQRALAEFKKENSNKPNEGLKREEIVGLFGELYFWQNFLSARGVTAKRILELWKGWDAGPHDFVDTHWIAEIKTSLAVKIRDLWINGMSQLVGTPGKALFLCHIHFDSSQGGRRTLSSLVAELKATLADEKLEQEFMRRLESVGYDETLAVDYDYYKFPQSGDVTFYDVNRDGFPKIVAVVGEERIKAVKYKVSVLDLTEFVVPKVSWNTFFGSEE